VTAAARAVAFVGLGAMGLPMARRLLGAGVAVAGYDPRAERAAALAAAGGRAAPSAEAAADGAEAALLIPFDAAQLREALLGPAGALHRLPRGAPVVAMATIGPAAARELADAVVARGGAYVDAPVTGGVARAEAGTLAFIVSGAPDTLDRVAPLLAPMASAVYRVGTAPGAAQLVKLINQLLVFVHLAVAGEAMAMGAAAGVDLAQLYEVLVHGAGRSEIFASRARALLDGTPTGGTLGIALKDFPLVLETARELGVPLFTGAAAHQLVQLARAAGRADAEDTALIALLMEWATGSRE